MSSRSSSSVSSYSSSASSSGSESIGSDSSDDEFDFEEVIETFEKDDTPIFEPVFITPKSTLSEPAFEEDDDTLGPNLEAFLEYVTKKQQEQDDIEYRKKKLSEQHLQDEAKALIKLHPCKKITNEIYFKSSVSAKIGPPQVIKVNGNKIAIGTSRGLILLFSKDEEPEIILGSITGDYRTDNGSVTGLDFYVNNDFVVSGHASGHVIFWNPKLAGPVAKIEKAFNSPVKYVGFFEKNRVIGCSENGILKIVGYSKSFFRSSTETTTILPNMTCLDVAVLPINPKIKHPLNDQRIVAIVNDAKEVWIYSLHPIIKPLHDEPFKIKNENDANPCIAWRKPSSYELETGEIKFEMPILAVAWGTQLYMYQLKSDDMIGVYAPLELDDISDIIGIGWFGDSVLGIIDSDKNVRILDPFRGTIVETLSIKSLEFNPPSSTDFINNAGIYNQVMDTDDGLMYLLGGNGVTSVRVASWRERIDAYMKLNSFTEALKLALQFYNSEAPAVINLPKDDATLKQITSAMIGHIIIAYLDQTMDWHSKNQSNESSKQEIINLGNNCIKYCIEIQNYELLFKTVYQKYKDYKLEETFLELLEPYITSSSNVRLPVLAQDVFDAFVELYIKKEEFAALEKCIKRLDLEKINFEKLIECCEKYSLYSTYVYAYQSVKKENITPLKRLFEILIEKKPISPKALYNDIGFVILDLLHDLVQSTDEVLKETMDYLLKNSEQMFHLCEDKYIKKFFEILEIAFNNPSVHGMLKRFVEILGHKIPIPRVDDVDKCGTKYSHILIFVDFLVRAMAIGLLDPTNELAKVPILFQFISKDTVDSYRILADQKEQADYIRDKNTKAQKLQELELQRQELDEKKKIRANYLYTINEKIKKEDIDRRPIISSCRAAGFYRVLIDIYKENNEISHVIKSYLKDGDVNSVIEYIQPFLETKKAQIEEAIFDEPTYENLTMLIDTSVESAVNLADQLGIEERIIEVLKKRTEESHKHTLYKYIAGLLESPVSKKIQIDQDFHLIYLPLLVKYNPDGVKEYLRGHQFTDIESIIQVCQNIPEATSYLHERTGEISKALKGIIGQMKGKLQILKEKIISEADKKSKKQLEYYERLANENKMNGKVFSFFKFTKEPQIIIPNLPMEDQEFEEKHELPKIDTPDGPIDVLEMNEFLQVETELRKALEMCKHNTERKTLDDDEVHDLWFSLLETFIHLQRELKYGFFGEMISQKIKPKLEKKKKKKQKKKSEDDWDDEWDESDSEEEEDFGDMSDIAREIKLINNEIKEINEEIHEFISEKNRIDEEREKIKKDETLTDEEKQKQIKELDTEYQKIETRIKRRDAHILTLRTKIKEKEREKYLQEEEEKQAMNDPNAAHNISKLANLWLQKCVSECIRQILQIMMYYVEIPVIVENMIENHESDTFVQIKPNTMYMLQVYAYERIIINTSNDLLLGDNFLLGEEYYKNVTFGAHPKSLQCGSCEKQVKQDDELQFYFCGHIFHARCVLLRTMETLNLCPICNAKEVAEKEKEFSTEDIPKEKKKEKQSETDSVISSVRSRREIYHKVNKILHTESRFAILQKANEMKFFTSDQVMDQLKGSDGPVHMIFGKDLELAVPPVPRNRRRYKHAKNDLRTTGDNSVPPTPSKKSERKDDEKSDAPSEGSENKEKEEKEEEQAPTPTSVTSVRQTRKEELFKDLEKDRDVFDFLLNKD